MDIVSKMLLLLPVVAAIMVGFNIMLGGLAQIFHALKLSQAENFVGTVSGWIAKLLDLIHGNLAH